MQESSGNLKHQILSACRSGALLIYWDNDTQTIKSYTEVQQPLIKDQLKKIKRKLKHGDWVGGHPRGTEGSPRCERIKTEGYKLYPILVKSGSECPVMEIFQGGDGLVNNQTRWEPLENPNEWTPYFARNGVDQANVLEYLHSGRRGEEYEEVDL